MAKRPQRTETRSKKRDNKPQLSLHVPEPEYRPDAEEVDFSGIEIPEAGAQPRPDEACDPEETEDLCTDLSTDGAPGCIVARSVDPKTTRETLNVSS